MIVHHKHPDIKKAHLYILILTYGLFSLSIIVGTAVVRQKQIYDSAAAEKVRPSRTPKGGSSDGGGGGPVATPTPLPTIPPVSNCVDLPASIDSSGATDVTTAFQAAIDAAPNDSCLRLRAGGVYWVEEGLDIVDKTNFTFEGNGAELVSRNPGPTTISKYVRKLLSIVNSVRTTVQNLKVTGPNANGIYWPDHETENGVQINGGEGVTLKDLVIVNTYGDGVFIGGYTAVTSSGQAVPAKNVQIVATRKGQGGSFRIEKAGRQGITSVDSDGVVIDGIDMVSSSRSVVDLESPTADQNTVNFTFMNNHVGRSGLGFISMGGQGIRDNILIKNNLLTGKSMGGKMGNPSIGVQDRLNITFEGNTSTFEHDGAGALFSLNGVRTIKFINNTQPFRAGTNSTLVSINSDSCDVYASGNTLPNAVGLFSGTTTCSVVDGGGNSF